MESKGTVLYTALVKKESGRDIDFSFDESDGMEAYGLIKINLVGRIMFLVESMNLLAEQGLDEIGEIRIRIFSGEEGITVLREGNGILSGVIPDEAARILLFVLEVLDRRLANFCEAFGSMIQLQENC